MTSLLSKVIKQGIYGSTVVAGSQSLMH